MGLPLEFRIYFKALVLHYLSGMKVISQVTNIFAQMTEIHKTVESRKRLFSAIYMSITILRFKDIK